MNMSLDPLFERLQLKPQDRELYTLALTHTSYRNEHPECHADNQRLEFLGDAVIQLAVSQKIFHEKTEMQEGEMSLLRANLVRTETLAELAHLLELNEYLLLGAGETKARSKTRPSILCDAFESLFGAIYLDQGMDQAIATLLPLYQTLLATHGEARFMVLKDNKTRLQELVQADTRKVLEYVTNHVNGPSNQPFFEVAVKMDGVVLGIGHGSKKKEAEQDAARDALSKMAQ